MCRSHTFWNSVCAISQARSYQGCFYFLFVPVPRLCSGRPEFHRRASFASFYLLFCLSSGWTRFLH